MVPIYPTADDITGRKPMILKGS